MNLYAYQPTGHGQYSFFTIANSEKEAFEIIDQHVKNIGRDRFEVRGWGTDCYELTIGEPGRVVTNEND